MRKTATIEVRLVNADSRRRNLLVSYSDARLPESELQGPYELRYGGEPMPITISADEVTRLGAVDWIAEGATPTETHDGGETDLANNDPVEVALKP